MIRPLSDDEKRAALADGVKNTLEEAQRQAEHLRQVRETAKKVWWELLKAPVWEIEESPVPHGMTPMTEELWSVTPKVTTE